MKIIFRARRSRSEPEKNGINTGKKPHASRKFHIHLSLYTKIVKKF
ncbi:hypothetical protein ACEVJL_13840 [Pseudoflavonifractor sp. P01025]